jgi:hypothetical protein
MHSVAANIPPVSANLPARDSHCRNRSRVHAAPPGTSSLTAASSKSLVNGFASTFEAPKSFGDFEKIDGVPGHPTQDHHDFRR